MDLINSNVLIRKADISDKNKLSVLFSQVYMQTYGKEGISNEDANYICNNFSVSNIKDKIINNSGIFIVAEYNSRLTGVAEIEFNNKCPVNGLFSPEICKLYVLENFCGQGIGYKLLNEAESAARKKDKKEIWLTVYELNFRAISFYERQGYTYAGDFLFKMELNSYLNKVMIKKL